jgi:hypothetical protein
MPVTTATASNETATLQDQQICEGHTAGVPSRWIVDVSMNGMNDGEGQ